MVFPVFYFGPISYFNELIKAECVKFEIHENFVKQTYRNRCYIQAANGKLRLAIPTNHSGSRKMKDLRVSTESNWKKEHFKSLVSAYKSSPFFDYYEEEIAHIYEQKIDFLLDFNLKTIEFVLSKLKVDVTFNLTESYEPVSAEFDFRNKFNAKKEPENLFPEYIQVFNEKHGFMPDLSILDLICNEGPHATTYLKELV